MAVSDMMFAITVVFTTTGTVVQYKFNYNLMLAWMIYIGGVSYYSVVGLNVDRAYAVYNPVKASQRSKKTIMYGIITCWLLPIAISIFYIFDQSLVECGKECHACWVAVDNVRSRILA